MRKGEENRPFSDAPSRDPISVPMHKGIRIPICTKPWHSLNVELTKAFKLKQASEDPMATFIGALRIKEKAGTSMGWLEILFEISKK